VSSFCIFCITPLQASLRPSPANTPVLGPSPAALVEKPRSGSKSDRSRASPCPESMQNLKNFRPSQNAKKPVLCELLEFVFRKVLIVGARGFERIQGRHCSHVLLFDRRGASLGPYSIVGFATEVRVVLAGQATRLPPRHQSTALRDYLIIRTADHSRYTSTQERRFLRRPAGMSRSNLGLTSSRAPPSASVNTRNS